MPESIIKLAHFGYGYWGPNLVRNFEALESCEVKRIIDADEANRQQAASKYPNALVSSQAEDALNDPEIAAVIVATPAETHFELCQRALMAGKHVFVEKPLCSNYADAQTLVAMADEQRRILFTGHVFIYNNAVREAKKLIREGELGDLLCIHSQRLSLGRVRSDVDVLWNLAPHDISILLYLLDEEPVSINGYGHSFLQPGINDIGFIDLVFPSGTVGHIHCSWLHPKKTREMVIVGTRKMLVYDDVSTDAKIAIYDCGAKKTPKGATPPPFESFANFQLFKRAGGLSVPRIDFPEPLSEQAKAFIHSIKTGEPPKTDGKMGALVVGILEKASQRRQAAPTTEEAKNVEPRNPLERRKP